MNRIINRIINHIIQPNYSSAVNRAAEICRSETEAGRSSSRVSRNRWKFGQPESDRTGAQSDCTQFANHKLGSVVIAFNHRRIGSEVSLMADYKMVKTN